VSDRIAAFPRVVVAYSGGVDSALVAALAVDRIGDRALAVTGVSPALAPHLREEARAQARWLGLRHQEILTAELEDPAYANNPSDRCYACKRELHSLLVPLAAGAAQVLDGVNNLDYWKGKSAVSNRDSFLYYYESDIKAVRVGPWKLHFATSENYYDVYQPQKFPIIFNLRMDPFESYDEVADRSAVLQRKQWLNEPVQELLNEHIRTLIEHPPVQAAASFDFSALIKQVTAGAN
jgi:hypothetical protein